MLKKIDQLLWDSFIISNMLDYNLLPTSIMKGKIYTRMDITYSDFTSNDLKLLEYSFRDKMIELGFDLKGYASTEKPIFESIKLIHFMIFSIPLSMRLTRPSMKILLGLS